MDLSVHVFLCCRKHHLSGCEITNHTVWRQLGSLRELTGFMVRLLGRVFAKVVALQWTWFNNIVSSIGGITSYQMKANKQLFEMTVMTERALLWSTGRGIVIETRQLQASYSLDTYGSRGRIKNAFPLKLNLPTYQPTNGLTTTYLPMYLPTYQTNILY